MAVMKEVTALARGMNELCVTRGMKPGGRGGQVEWPKDHVLYRGGGIPDQHQGGIRGG